MKKLDVELLERLYNDRVTVVEIAEKFGVCVETINRAVKRLGLSREKIPTFDDISGKRFGRLIALRPVRIDRFGKYVWRVRCDCGREKDINASGMKAGLVHSCGCLKREKLSTGYKELSGAYWRKIEKAAHRRGYEFSISKEYAWGEYVKQGKKCALSGVPIVMFSNNDKYYLQTASLDRIDSSLGYVEGNIQWVHKRVNFLKRDYSEAELVFWCREIVKKSSEKLGDFRFELIQRERRGLNEDIKTIKAE